MVVLRSGRDDGLCFVETSQLDGYTLIPSTSLYNQLFCLGLHLFRVLGSFSLLRSETNLKTHVSVGYTMAMTEEQLTTVKGSVVADNPNKHFTFKVPYFFSLPYFPSVKFSRLICLLGLPSCPR
jgi:hypothetical protein